MPRPTVVRDERGRPEGVILSSPSRIYLGIDPGASGGIVALGAGRVARLNLGTATMRDVWDWIRGMSPNLTNDGMSFCVIEKVGGFIQGNAAPGSAMFNFGKSYGALLMALTAAGIPFEEVIPQKWQKAMGVPTRDNKGGESRSDHKRKLKAKAQQLFPGIVVTNWLADALLIALYAQRSREGTL